MPDDVERSHRSDVSVKRDRALSLSSGEEGFDICRVTDRGRAPMISSIINLTEAEVLLRLAMLESSWRVDVLSFILRVFW